MGVDLDLGGFRLVRPLVRGGVGHVWQGVHAAQGVPVAIKVIPPDVLGDSRVAVALRHEVRAVAALDHPGIVWVYDHGEVDAAAARASGGRLREGSAWLAMEFASGGSLARVKRPMRWSALRDVALALLDALAHAHARGVVHRDLKPGNVLVCTDSDPRPGLKLTDFGIAHAFGWRDAGGSREWMAGTPAYMAPEQILGRWRDYGPWTDLYALGCLVYRLVSGEVPFAGLEGMALTQAHLDQELPALPAHAGYPDGFPAWVARLARRDARGRYRCAADAAWALLRLAPPADEEPERLEDVLGDLDALDLASAAFGDVVPRTPRPVPRRHVPRAAPASDAPPMAPDWRHPEAPPRPAPLVGAGLGLWGLRAVPMVGREPQRDALWQALRDVHDQREARVVYLYGPAGTGKSRLAGWLCRRASELGGATVLRADHGPLGGPAYGLRRMLANAFRCVRLGADAVHARVEAELGAKASLDVDALTELIAPSRGRDGGRVALETPAQRHAVVVRYIRRLAKRRPVILWLEDVHWGAEAVGLAEHLVQAAHATPVLVLLTARDSELAERPELAERVERLADRPHATRLRVGPLAPAARRQLVQGLLGLEGTLAAHVEERTGGNPLFAVQLVGHWVQQGLLEPGPGGFTLRIPPHDAVPADLHEVWALRVERALLGLGDDARVALERAAALGLSVDDDEWAAVCQGGADIRSAVVDRLLASRLVVPVGGGWMFAHAMLRESVERASRREGRWAGHHRACAAMLEAHRGEPGVAERLGRHLVEAGALEDALEPLMIGVRERKRAAGVREALSLLRTCEDAMLALRLPEDDARWGLLHVRRAELSGMQGDLVEADRWCEIALQGAAKHGWSEVAVRAGVERAEVSLMKRDLVAARLALEPALDGARALALPALEGRCLQGLGRIAQLSWDADGARALFADAIARFDACGHAVAVADCDRLLGRLEVECGHPDLCRDHVSKALAVYERHGRRHGIAACLNEIAELDRAAGRLDDAEAGYRRALSILDTLGVARAAIPELNLAMILMIRGQFDEARALTDRSRAQLERNDWRPLLAAAHVMLACCAAAARDWSAWDRHLGPARGLLRETGFADRDIAWSAATAGRLCEDAGRALQACQAYRVALAQWMIVGDQVEVDTVRHTLERLTDRAPVPQRT